MDALLLLSLPPLFLKFHDRRVGSAAQLLTTGAPFAEILSRWREIARLFEDAALPPLIQRLEQQIAEDRDLKVLGADAISQMTAAEKARYWRSRLPEY